MTTGDQENIETSLYSQDDLEAAKEELEALNAEGYLGLKAYIQALEEQATLPEAAGSASAYMRGPNGTEVLLVSRGVSSDAAWDALERTVKRLINKGFGPVTKYPAASHTPAQTNEGDAPKNTAPSSTRSQVSTTENEYLVDRIEIEPKPDARASIKFFAPSLMYAVLQINNWPRKKLAEFLSKSGDNFTESDLGEAKSVSVHWVASWENSKTRFSQKGNPYKDVTGLRKPG